MDGRPLDGHVRQACQFVVGDVEDHGELVHVLLDRPQRVVGEVEAGEAR